MYIKVIPEGCPVCKGEVRGNHKYLYFCAKCTLLFRYSALRKPVNVSKIVSDKEHLKKKH